MTGLQTTSEVLLLYDFLLRHQTKRQAHFECLPRLGRPARQRARAGGVIQKIAPVGTAPEFSPELLVGEDPLVPGSRRGKVRRGGGHVTRLPEGLPRHCVDLRDAHGGVEIASVHREGALVARGDGLLEVAQPLLGPQAHGLRHRDVAVSYGVHRPRGRDLHRGRLGEVPQSLSQELAPLLWAAPLALRHPEKVGAPGLQEPDQVVPLGGVRHAAASLVGRVRLREGPPGLDVVAAVRELLRHLLKKVAAVQVGVGVVRTYRKGFVVGRQSFAQELNDLGAGLCVLGPHA
mmetsp:Transcript_2246/g.7516  ORF Transcript_2246/g.7516 Transcript_2246/m.7516 type:complete len:290 (-) Transcript_2246:465-1334(-)